MTSTESVTDYKHVVELWYDKNNDDLQRMIGGLVRRKGNHGEGYDEMRAELNYWVFQHIRSAARRGVIGKVVLCMAVDYAYRHWVSDKRSYQNRQGRHDLAEETKPERFGEEWQFPESKRPDDPAMRARYHLDIQMIGSRMKPKAQKVLCAFISDPHATDRSVSEALGKGWHSKCVFQYRQIIKKVLANAGYTPPPKRLVRAPPEVHAMGRKVACIYDACQRTPHASYMEIARRLGCQRSHVRWAVHKFASMGLPWAAVLATKNLHVRPTPSPKASTEIPAPTGP